MYHVSSRAPSGLCLTCAGSLCQWPSVPSCVLYVAGCESLSQVCVSCVYTVMLMCVGPGGSCVFCGTDTGLNVIIIFFRYVLCFLVMCVVERVLTFYVCMVLGLGPGCPGGGLCGPPLLNVLICPPLERGGGSDTVGWLSSPASVCQLYYVYFQLLWFWLFPPMVVVVLCWVLWGFWSRCVFHPWDECN